MEHLGHKHSNDSTRSRAIQNRVLFGHIPLSMLEYIREIDAEAAATRRYLESMS